MVLPAILVGAEAIRSNRLERRALDALGESMARTRTYAELETAMFDQGEIVWRYLSGLDPGARREFELAGEVVAYWQARWRAELGPNESDLAAGVDAIQAEIRQVSEQVFSLADSGRREAAFALAQRELRGRLQPALTQMNRAVYRRARESSVRGAYQRLEEILAGEGRTLVVIIVLSIVIGLGASWIISRGLARPIRDLTAAMAVVGTGKLDHPVTPTSRDEIGELAEAFASRGVDAWFDRGLEAGENWRTQIVENIETAKIFVVLFSQAVNETEEVLKEINKDVPVLIRSDEKANPE